MLPSIDLRIANMIKALEQVILPALPKRERLARDQANLVIGHLRLMSPQWKTAVRFEEVTLDLIAAKRYSDGLGKETDAAVDDWIEVGIFARDAGADSDQKVLYLERKHITEGAPRLTVVVDEEPSEAGFDPYNKLIDRVPADNRKRVEIL